MEQEICIPIHFPLLHANLGAIVPQKRKQYLKQCKKLDFHTISCLTSLFGVTEVLIDHIFFKMNASLKIRKFLWSIRYKFDATFMQVVSSAASRKSKFR